MDIIERIKETVESTPIVLFMKGNPQFPQCGFSAKTVEALKSCETEFSYVDVLEEPSVRENLPKYSDWPTFPQLFVGGELIGGCDIVLELHEQGELQQITKAAVS
ncbi:MAG: Grx4 family monothiol glutaredoxin [Gammaproteobacteria bacterium]